MKKDRVVYFDYLRVFATLAVMVLHVASQNWSGLDPAGAMSGTFLTFTTAWSGGACPSLL